MLDLALGADGVVVFIHASQGPSSLAWWRFTRASCTDSAAGKTPGPLPPKVSSKALSSNSPTTRGLRPLHPCKHCDASATQEKRKRSDSPEGLRIMP